MALISGQFFTTRPDADPCPFEVICDTDEQGLKARKALDTAGIIVTERALIGHFTMLLAQPDDWDIIGRIEGLVLRPYETLTS